jgi:hypothetical protein
MCNRYYPCLWKKLIVRWLYFAPPLHLVGCDAALKVIRLPELASLETNILEVQILQQIIPPTAWPRVVRPLNISHRLTSLAGNILTAVIAKRNHTMWTDWKLTMTNVTQFRWMKGYYPTGFYHMPASFTMSHHGWNRVGAPEWPSTSCQLIVYSWTICREHHHLKILTTKNL